MKRSDYHCSVCALPCYEIDGVVTRICTHENAAIVAERTSTLFGEGGARESSLLERLFVAARKILSPGK